MNKKLLKFSKKKIILIGLITIFIISGFIYYSKIYLPNKISKQTLDKYIKMHLTAKAEISLFEKCVNKNREKVKRTVSETCDLLYQKVKKSYDSCRLHLSHTSCVEYNDIEAAKCTDELINKNTEEMLVEKCLNKKLTNTIDDIKNFFDSSEYELLNQDDKNAALFALLVSWQSEGRGYLEEIINEIITYGFKYKEEIEFNSKLIEDFKK